MEKSAGSSGTCDEPAKRPRFGEPLKFLPIIFVACTIGGLWCIYVVCHCVPLLQLGQSANSIDHDMRRRGMMELVVFHLITTMLLICYVLSVIVHPGMIPSNDSHWEYLPHDARGMSDTAPLSLQETKKSGDRRHCKWCGKYKPDRCHHCRVCKTCILKMDHHCPWIYNCVGFFNYKFFFLLLFYSVLDCHLIFWSMLESINKVFVELPGFWTMFFIFFGETLAFFLGVLVTMFFCFHIWLMLKAMTTIEFCEKSLPKKESENRTYDHSVYDLGFYSNIKVVLGENPLFWLVPCMRPRGDGLNFVCDETTLTTSMEQGRGMRIRSHQKTQRSRLHGHRGGYGEYDGYGAVSPGFTPSGYGYGSISYGSNRYEELRR